MNPLGYNSISVRHDPCAMFGDEWVVLISTDCAALAVPVALWQLRELHHEITHIIERNPE